MRGFPHDVFHSGSKHDLIHQKVRGMKREHYPKKVENGASHMSSKNLVVEPSLLIFSWANTGTNRIMEMKKRFGMAR
jgi:hypothetical protein